MGMRLCLFYFKVGQMYYYKRRTDGFFDRQPVIQLCPVLFLCCFTLGNRRTLKLFIFGNLISKNI